MTTLASSISDIRNARVAIYDSDMLIIQATGLKKDCKKIIKIFV